MILRYAVALFVIMTVVSCGKKETPVRPVDPGPPTPVTPIDPAATGKAKKVRMDSLANAIRKWAVNNIVRDSVWQDSAGVSFFIKYGAGWFRFNNDNLFPGNTINAVKFKTDELEFLPGPDNQQVKIFTTVPAIKKGDTVVAASKAAVDGVLRYWFRENKGPISALGSGRAVTFTDYATLSLAFPGTLTARHFDPIPVQQMVPAASHAALEKKTGCMVYSVGTYHTIYFDYNDGLQRYKNYYATNAADKGIISSVSYGHEVYVFLEADTPEDKLRPAMNRTLDGTETAEDIELLRQAKARVYYRHTSADKVSKDNLNGYDRLKEYVNILTKTPFQYTGVPVYYSVMNTAGADTEVNRILKVDFKL
ncbi:hypothetical protein SAMN04488128_1011839 [Chitinophaga eiseniae]|uniref:Thiol-activated cytolysin n=1 Tax=Chitinophaga eiseniae TaxID=634771 RepID=A0A1T4P023_9BACT|nr:hypothetical protein [Chitinophaga eiseniae]SJZ84815.1 hypothetical protein SAMN04488128_1011839 [Chitinophaga eiseniae]